MRPNNIYSTEHIYTGLNPKNEFFIPKNKTIKYGRYFLKCCITSVVIVGLNAMSFYVGYLVASTDSSESL